MLKKLKDFYYFSWLSFAFQKLITATVLKIYYQYIRKIQITYVGAKPDPSKNYLIVSNHRSYADPPMIGFATKLPVSFIAKKELFKNPFLAVFMFLTSTVSIDRENTKPSTFKEAVKAMKQFSMGCGWSGAIFIEGTRTTTDGLLSEPQAGTIFLARLAKVPILPVGISYRKNKIIFNIGEAYEIDYKGDLQEQSWHCLNKIAELTDYQLPMNKAW